MPLTLHLGPPASGKTTALLDLAANASSTLVGVWWVGLPHQRERTQARVARALAHEGETRALPRYEFLTLQQLLYRLIERGGDIPPPLASPGLQLAHAAIAVQRTFERPPSPGEAHLYLHAIRDAKRADLAPEELPDSPAAHDLARVYRAYESVRAGKWADFEDYRQRAHALLRSATPPKVPLVILDGFLDLPPADLRLIEALARHARVHLALERDVPTLGRAHAIRYPAPPARARRSVRLPNPLEETRWVLSSVKRDLHEGVSPHELAIIAPPAEHHAFEALAPSFGIPLRSSRAPTLADTRAGRLLARLLALAHDASPEALRAVPTLAPLARALAERDLHGSEAAERVADELALRAELDAWRERLALPSDPAAAAGYVERVLDTVVALDPELAHDPAWGERREQLRVRGGEASTIDLARLPTWWPLLLGQYHDPSERPEGVALLEPDAATGVRFERAYLTRASAQSYAHAVTEDYFVSEDERQPRDPRATGLPQRVSDRSAWLAAHLLERAEHLTVSAPAADQDVPLESDPRLIDEATLEEALALPAGRALEAHAPAPAIPRGSWRVSADDARPRLGVLQRLANDRCGFRAHFEALARPSGDAPAWLKLIGALTKLDRLTPKRQAALERDFPAYAPWIARHAAAFARMTFGVRLPHPSGAVALVHALHRERGRLVLTKFLPADTELDAKAQQKKLAEDWERRAALSALALAFASPVSAQVWPIGGEPLALDAPSARDPEGVEEALARYREGDAAPAPGFHCRHCPIARACPAR
jgi:hypothetical protein